MPTFGRRSSPYLEVTPPGKHLNRLPFRLNFDWLNKFKQHYLDLLILRPFPASFGQDSPLKSPHFTAELMQTWVVILHHLIKNSNDNLIIESNSHFNEK